LNAQARPVGVRKKLFTTAAAKGSIMGTRTWSAIEAFFKLLKRPVIKGDQTSVADLDFNLQLNA